MKTAIFTLICLLGLGLSARAQNGQLHIEQEPGIEKLLAIYAQGIAKAGYYTIQVGFGSFSAAEELKRDVEIDFPQWQAKIVFDSPTYRVQVGRFKSRLEAEREYREVRKKFPAALLLRPEEK
ncbi:SPOR domain-containing protein [Robiginitalea sp. M366]|uniref:SPOR domain-containing protein n=1 Tax=Robiginitalea aestuariiviva TaxID=3036903 RepID=UPI00240E3442|nr:SPOR domain-containing protein [Robiginitalea aestuariiviva]MDG1571027.1 SPOR domain-containing protein [Robiginitalea aestuariiviva]